MITQPLNTVAYQKNRLIAPHLFIRQIRISHEYNRQIDSLRPVTEDTAVQIKEYLADYGEKLIEFPEQAWETSIYIWQGSFWDVLVDLWTEGEGLSDLALQLKVFETAEGYEFEVYMVYVP